MNHLHLPSAVHGHAAVAEGRRLRGVDRERIVQEAPAFPGSTRPGRAYRRVSRPSRSAWPGPVPLEKVIVAGTAVLGTVNRAVQLLIKDVHLMTQTGPAEEHRGHQARDRPWTAWVVSQMCRSGNVDGDPVAASWASTPMSPNR